jgi:hypothetical protein
VRIGAPPARIAPISNKGKWARIGANERITPEIDMKTIFTPPESASGYLIDGTPVFDLGDVAAARGMTYAECEDALADFLFWATLQGAEMGALTAGVMTEGDHRIHRVQ